MRIDYRKGYFIAEDITTTIPEGFAPFGINYACFSAEQANKNIDSMTPKAVAASVAMMRHKKNSAAKKATLDPKYVPEGLTPFPYQCVGSRLLAKFPIQMMADAMK